MKTLTMMIAAAAMVVSGMAYAAAPGMQHGPVMKKLVVTTSQPVPEKKVKYIQKVCGKSAMMHSIKGKNVLVLNLSTASKDCKKAVYYGIKHAVKGMKGKAMVGTSKVGMMQVGHDKYLYKIQKVCMKHEGCVMNITGTQVMPKKQ